jgi:type VI secretion system protein ImpL
LDDPIGRADALLRTVGAAEINAASSAFCPLFRQLMAKYPFNPRATTSASPADVSKMFQPGSGSLWLLYENALQKVLAKRGAQFAASEAGTVRVTPAFVRFFNRAAAISEALYKDGGAEPRLSFTLTPILAPGITSATVSLESQTAKFSGESAETKPFLRLNAAGAAAELSAQLGDIDWTLAKYQEPWAVFRLFRGADRWQQSGDGYTVEWTLRQGRRPLTAGGSTAKVAFQLNLGGAPPMLKPGFFDGLSCPGVVVE